MALFQKQKQEKKRKGENVIGKIIYGFLLFAPLFNILVTCMYVTFNKNAYQSYYGETINQKTEINIDYDKLQNNQNYIFKNEITANRPETANTGNMYVSNVKNLNGFNNNSDLTNTYIIRFYLTNDFNTLFFQDINGNTITQAGLYNNILEFSFDFLGYTPNYTGFSYANYFYKIEYNKNSYLDNAFIYGTYKTEESSLFNWAKETGTYTVLTNVTNGIGITNTFIPMLMAYWLIISVVYFLFDIALILIWAVHDKIHELKDAI